MDEGVKSTRPQQNYSEIFDECFPFYLSIGMTFEQYWQGDNDLPKHFRKAYKMRQEQMNHEAWLHGLYVYDAVVSAMSHLNEKQSSHRNYTEKPYSFDKEKVEEEKVIEAEAQAEVWLKSWVAATQQMFKNE